MQNVTLPLTSTMKLFFVLTSNINNLHALLFKNLIPLELKCHKAGSDDDTQKINIKEWDFSLSFQRNVFI